MPFLCINHGDPWIQGEMQYRWARHLSW
jgi:hypothetical protein